MYDNYSGAKCDDCDKLTLNHLVFRNFHLMKIKYMKIKYFHFCFRPFTVLYSQTLKVVTHQTRNAALCRSTNLKVLPIWWLDEVFWIATLNWMWSVWYLWAVLVCDNLNSTALHPGSSPCKDVVLNKNLTKSQWDDPFGSQNSLVWHDLHCWSPRLPDTVLMR